MTISKKEAAFRHYRQSSLKYLEGIDDRGWIGWEKLDPILQNTIHGLHQNPNTFHYGESCSGHGYKGPQTEGRIAVGIRENRTAATLLIKDLEKIVDETPEAKIDKIKVPYHVEGELIEKVQVFPITIHGKDMSVHKKFWAQVEAAVTKHAKKYAPIWNPEETKNFRPPRTTEFLVEQLLT